jgi:hypothetical protein
MSREAAREGKWARGLSVVLPREHGSWSLALEPLAFGLIAAPSAGGACLALAVVAAFFARRPLRMLCGETVSPNRAEARGPLALLVALAVLALAATVALGGMAWLGWLLPVAAAGAVFLYFDLRAAGREGVAEVAGAAAFALVPAALAALAGWKAPAAGALALVMVGRAVPAVLTVRACLRGAKTGRRQPALALLTAAGALGAGVALVRGGLAPTMAAGFLVVLAVRTAALLVWPRPILRARTLGMIETVLGLGFVLAVALAWRAR